MNVIDMAVHVHLISNDMTPEPRLPDSTPIHPLPSAIQVGERQLHASDDTCQVAIPGINDRMKVIREYYPGTYFKRDAILDPVHTFDQNVKMLNQEWYSPICNCRYEVCLPRAVVTE